MPETALSLEALPAETAAILQPIPMRRAAASVREEELQAPPPPFTLPRVGLLSLARRALQWGRAAARLSLGQLQDRARGDRSDEARGRRLCGFFKDVGGTAVKIGQQLSNRVDLLPYAVCAELATLTDEVPPFPLRDALPAIEAAIGDRLDAVFDIIDPEPIGSASVAAVFQARLLSGERVAVKVRRPGIERALAADILLARIATRMMELLTLVREGQYANVRVALEDIFSEELNFESEARYQTLYREAAKKAGFKWVTAPKIYHRYSSRDVLVSAFAAGVSGNEVMAAVADDSPEAHAWLARHGIDRKRLARRLLLQQFWRRKSEQFFHADPHPGNFLVQPGSRLVMLDFGACGVLPALSGMLDLKAVKAVRRYEIDRAAELGIAHIPERPQVDMRVVRRRMLRRTWTFRLARSSPHAPWWQRHMAGNLMAMARTGREMKVPLTSADLNLARAILVYDTLALRLDPELNTQRLLERFMARVHALRGKALARRRAQRDQKWALAAEICRLRRSVDWVSTFLSVLTRNLRPQYNSVAKKGAFTFGVALQQAARAAVALALFTAAIATLALIRGTLLPPYEALQRALHNPALLALFTLLFVQAARWIAARLEEPDAS